MSCAPTQPPKVDLGDLEEHLKQRLALAAHCLDLTDGDAADTAATVNSARLALAKLREEVRQTREEMDRWKQQLKQVLNQQRV